MSNAQVEEDWTAYYFYDNENQTGQHITPTLNNEFTYLTMYSFEENGRENVILIKVNSEGTVEWEQFFAGPAQETDIINDVVLDTSDNSIWLAGFGSFFGGTTSHLTLKYNSEGDLLAQHQFDNQLFGGDYFNAIDIDEKGTVYCSGKILFDSTTLFAYDKSGIEKWAVKNSWSYRISNKDVVYQDGFIYVNGYEFHPEASYLHLAKYDTLGNELWYNRFNEYPPFRHPSIRTMYIDDIGDIHILTGGLSNTSEFLKLSKYNGINGNLFVEYPLTQYYSSPHSQIISQGTFLGQGYTIRKIGEVGQLVWEIDLSLISNQVDLSDNLSYRQLTVNNDWLIYSGFYGGDTGSYLALIHPSTGELVWDTLVTDIGIIKTEVMGNYFYATGFGFDCPIADYCTYLRRYHILENSLNVISNLNAVDPIEVLFVHPNPTKDQVLFSFPNLEKAEMLNIYNTSGQLVLQETITAFTSEKTLNLQDFSNGIYYYQFGGNSGKLVIE